MKLQIKTISAAMILSLLVTPSIYGADTGPDNAYLQKAAIAGTSAVPGEHPDNPNPTQRQLADQETMALLWMKTSAEYRALAYQAYNAAALEIDRAVAEHRPSDKPLAIILDCDETIVSNIKALSQAAAKGNGQYPAPWWRKTVHDTQAVALPGAKEFLNATAAKGVEIYYVSNRYEPVNLDPSLAALQAAGFPQADKEHLRLMTDSGDKRARFDKIRETHHVILYLGDNYGDFPLPKAETSNDRNLSVDTVSDNWGTKFIMLPNPVYGSWVSALSKDYQTMDPTMRTDLVKALLND